MTKLEEFARKNPPTRQRQNMPHKKVAEPETFDQMLEKLGTKAGVIRYLTSLGRYDRNSIAEFVGSHYQYVRAVQVQNVDGSGSGTSSSTAPTQSQPSGSNGNKQEETRRRAA